MRSMVKAVKYVSFVVFELFNVKVVIKIQTYLYGVLKNVFLKPLKILDFSDNISNHRPFIFVLSRDFNGWLD